MRKLNSESSKRGNSPLGQRQSHHRSKNSSISYLAAYARLKQSNVTCRGKIQNKPPPPQRRRFIKKLTSYIPPARMITTAWLHIKGLELADPQFFNSLPIDLVLGVEVYGAILENGLIKGDSESPMCPVDHELKELLQQFWLQEETGARRKITLSEDDAQCERHFVETHSRLSDGPYVMRLPFKRNPDDLGNSRKPALFALLRQERRFASDSQLKKAYTEFLSEYESLYNMKRVAETEPEPRRVFYLPHHAVIRESSATTKKWPQMGALWNPSRGREFSGKSPRDL
nr:uncharacterized protein LOC124223690 [Neodiprion pinetum]